MGYMDPAVEFIQHALILANQNTSRKVYTWGLDPSCNDTCFSGGGSDSLAVNITIIPLEAAVFAVTMLPFSQRKH